MVKFVSDRDSDSAPLGPTQSAGSEVHDYSFSVQLRKPFRIPQGTCLSIFFKFNAKNKLITLPLKLNADIAFVG